MLGPKHARREDRCPLYRVLRKITSDRSEIGLGCALSIWEQRDIVAFLSFGPGGCHFEGFRGDMSHFKVNFDVSSARLQTLNGKIHTLQTL